MIVTFVLLYEVVNKKNDFKDIIFLGLLMSFVMSGYESLIFAYISEVFIVLFIKYVINNNNNNHKISDWLKEGFSYAIPLFVALVLKYVIGYILLFINGLHYVQDGNTSLLWFEEDIYYILTRIAFNAYFYGIRGLSYLPIGEFVVASIIFIIIVILKQKNQNLVLY